MQAAQADTTNVLRYPTERKRPYQSGRVKRGQAYPTGVVPITNARRWTVTKALPPRTHEDLFREVFARLCRLEQA